MKNKMLPLIVLASLIIAGCTAPGAPVEQEIAEQETFKEENRETNTTIQKTVTKKTTYESSPIEGYYTFEEVAKHDTADDCWTIIYTRVYDITNILADHQEAKILGSKCGTIGTEVFEYQSFVSPEMLSKTSTIGLVSPL